jgi:hypothetical protein
MARTPMPTREGRVCPKLRNGRKHFLAAQEFIDKRVRFSVKGHVVSDNSRTKHPGP